MHLKYPTFQILRLQFCLKWVFNREEWPCIFRALVSLVDEGWYRLTLSHSSPHWVLNFSVWNGPKKNSIPHNLLRDFGADKTSTTCWSGGRVQVWVQIRAPAGHLAITPEGYSRRQLVLRVKFWLQNQWPSSWGRAPAQLGRVGLASRRQSLQAATGSLEQNMPPFLRYWLTLRVKKVVMICKFRAATSHFFSCEMKFSMELARTPRSCCRPKPRSSLRSIFRSVIGLWVEIWHRNKSVQSSRSKSTTCPRKGRLLRFESNSTVTSDVGTQKLEMMSGMILNRSQPKFAAKSVTNEMQCFKAM